MAKSFSVSVLNASLNHIVNNSLLLTVCSIQPADFYAGVYPAARANLMAYTVGNVVRPTPWNQFVYKCTTGGTSGASAPVWPTTAGATVGDGTVTWTAVASALLAETSMTTADFGAIVTTAGGQELPVLAISGILSVAAGNGTYVAFLDTVNYDMPMVDPLTATIVVPNPGTVNLNAFTITIDQPV